jgi:CubicO group peptidase (beta-lactamase class C family)
MQESFIIDFVLQKDEVCQSYKSDGVNYGWDQFDAIVGDKNIYTTARDLLKFDIATYSDEFLPSSLKEEMLKGYSYETKGPNNYGLGIRMKEFENGEKIHYHNGWWHGNTSSYVTLKKDTVTIIALSNRYSKKPYGVVKLSSIFGDYPYSL